MRVTPQDLFSRAEVSSRLRRVLRLPPMRIVVAMAFLGPAIITFNVVFGRLIDAEVRWSSWPGDVAAVIVVGLTMWGYRFYVRLVERRPAYELQRTGCVVETASGFGLSAALVIMTLLAIVAIGSYRIASVNPASTLVHGFFVFGLLAFFEEIIFRVILLRLLEESVGTWLAIVLVGAVFGAAHLIHDEATLLSAAAIAVQDLILSGAFVLTRKVWLCWGIHWGWNFVQDGVLGMPNSSVDVLPSLLNPEVSGPTWLTGGGFGIELSVVGVVLNILAGVVLIKLAVDRGQLLRPGWKR
jgi:hypothetical protein